jgi:AcrR family transcriptional regulator
MYMDERIDRLQSSPAAADKVADPGSIIPRDEFLSALPETARNLLEATRRLFIAGGFGALRLEAIAKESGENKAMIRYYFGGKDGLIQALMDSMIHDVSIALARRAERLPIGEERIHVYLEGARHIAEDPDQRLSLFDVLPRAMREEKFRSRLADLYKWWREINERCLGVDKDSDNYEFLSALAMLVLGAVDGLAIQAAIDPDVDIGPAFDVLESIVTTGLKLYP